MKIILLIFSVNLLSYTCLAQKFEWISTSKQGNTNPANAPVVLDASGNIYTYMRTSQGLPVIIEQDTFLIPGPGTAGFCVVKFDAGGNVTWGKMFSSANSFPTSIAVDEGGSVYVAAALDGPQTHAYDTVYNNNGLSFQVFKLNASGDFIRTLYMSNLPTVAPYIAAHETSLYINFFGTIEKRDSAFNVIWSHSAISGSVSFNSSMTSAFLLDEGILVATAHEGSIGTVIPFSNDTLNFSQAGAFNESLILVMDTSGQVLWQYPLAYGSVKSALGRDIQGNIYAGVSSLSGTTIFGNDTLVNTIGPGSAYCAVLKWDNAGLPLNAFPVYVVGGSSTIYDMDLNSQNEIFFTLNSPAATVGNIVLPYNDVLVKLDDAGAYVWHKTADNNYTIKMDGIRVRNGNEYVVGGGVDVPLVSGCIAANTSGNTGNHVLMISELIENYPVASFTQSVNGFTYQFTDQSQNALSWHWNFGDGDTSNLQNPLHTYVSGGNYTVTLTVTNGACVSVFSYQILGLGLENSDAHMALHVNPSPAMNVLNISCTVNINTCILMDLTGKVISTTPIESARSTSLDIAHLQPGCYLLSVISDASVQTVRFVKGVE